MKYIKVLLIFLFISSIQVNLFSQLEFVRNENVRVMVNGSFLTNPWAGGINSAQVSRIDLNNNGILDLFVFDKSGNRVLTFLNTDNTPGAISYNHEYEYKFDFPNLKHWALLRDFNCDGLVDIYTNNFNGITVYENVSTGSDLEFNLRVESLISSYNLSGSPFNAPVYCLEVDIPSIVDIDEDGDMDILTWTENAQTVYLYLNDASDFESCDTLAYHVANRCYGLFSEAAESSELIYGDTTICSFNVVDPEMRHSIHSGGILLNIDLDQNGTKEIILSDVTETTMTALYLEEGDSGLDSAVSHYSTFPSENLNTLEVNMEVFPAGFYEDIDNDGIKDLFASPNKANSARDYNSLWYYKNNGVNDLPDFELIQENFLQDQMIDLGLGASPIAVDYNQDGLMDLLICNHNNYVETGNETSRISLYENTGDVDFPEFVLISSNYLNISSLGLEHVYPTVGDINNDGNIELILGNKDGKLFLFNNSSPAGQPVNWVFDPIPMEDFENNTIDIGKDAAPQLIDVNNDGSLDLIVGEQNGNINYIENIGTEAEFSFEHMIDTIGDVVATNLTGIKGNSIPFMWRNDDNLLELIVGTEAGVINHYTDIEGNLDGVFALETESVESINEGTFSAPVLYDFTNDGLLDMITGNIGGGLAFYEGGNTITISVDEIQPTQILNVYPNPASQILTVGFASEMNSKSELKMYNSSGKLVLTKSNFTNGEQINISKLSNGIYFISLVSEVNQYYSQQFIKQ